MTTYEFYRDIHIGTADEASFLTAVSAAETVIRALLYPTVTDDLSEVQLAGFHRAVCLQVDYSLANRQTARIKSESLGDRSVTYELDSAAGGLTVMGAAVSPQAVMLLEGCGCLSRWV